VCAHVCVCVCVCVCVYIYMYTYTYIYIYVLIYVYTTSPALAPLPPQYKLFRRSFFIDAAVWVWNVLSECCQCWKLVWSEKDSEAVLGVWLPAPLPTPRALPDHGAIWPLAIGVEKDLGGIDVWPCGIVCCSLCGLTHPPGIGSLFITYADSFVFEFILCVTLRSITLVYRSFSTSMSRP